jgi:hypothetical protein
VACRKGASGDTNRNGCGGDDLCDGHGTSLSVIADLASEARRKPKGLPLSTSCQINFVCQIN